MYPAIPPDGDDDEEVDRGPFDPGGQFDELTGDFTVELVPAALGGDHLEWSEPDDADGCRVDESPTIEEELPGPIRVRNAFTSFLQGDVSARSVECLSDLDAEGASAFERAWPLLDDDTRARVVRWMAELPEDRVETHFGRVLRIALADSSAVVRQLAITGLWLDDGNDLPYRLLALLNADESPDVRAEAAHGLARFTRGAVTDGEAPGDTDAIRTRLLDLASDEHQPLIVRRRALESVAVYGAGTNEIARRVRLAITAAFEDEETGLRASALYAMGQTMDRSWLQSISEDLRNEDAELRFEAVRALGEIGETAMIADVAELTDDADPEVRLASITALGKIGGNGAARVLRALIEQVSAEERDIIQEALDEALFMTELVREQE